MKPFFRQRVIVDSQGGFVLVTAMLILLILVVLGIAATTTSIFESQIAGSDKVHKTTFYAADGGSEVGGELIRQNVNCTAGFTKTEADNSAIIPLKLKVENGRLTFWQRTLAEIPDAGGVMVSDTNRVSVYPSDYSAGAPHTNLNMGGKTELQQGSALQVAAGYEGKGKSIAQGGAAILYDVYSQHIGKVNSETVILTQWRHILGEETTCNY